MLPFENGKVEKKRDSLLFWSSRCMQEVTRVAESDFECDSSHFANIAEKFCNILIRTENDWARFITKYKLHQPNSPHKYEIK
jgi:hypothetical protein